MAANRQNALQVSLAGRVLADAYMVEEPLGEGGMSVIYRGVQLNVGRPVAIKVLRTMSGGRRVAPDAHLARFEREAVATSRLSHPHVVQLIDFGETEEGAPFLVLELLEGEDLYDLILREGRLSPHRAALIGVQITHALRAAHGLGIIHRDLKPENIFLCEFAGRHDFVKVMDFGVATMRGGVTPRLTTQGSALGTPLYMAPEQFRDSESVTPAADIYALGCVLWEMLVGQPPHSGGSYVTIADKHATAELPPLPRHAMDDDTHRRWSALISWLLAKDPKDRPTDISVVGESLDELVTLYRGRGDGLTAVPRAVPTPAPPRPPRQPRLGTRPHPPASITMDATPPAATPNRRPWVAAAAAGLLTAAALFLLLLPGSTEPASVSGPERIVATAPGAADPVREPPSTVLAETPDPAATDAAPEPEPTARSAPPLVADDGQPAADALQIEAPRPAAPVVLLPEDTRAPAARLKLTSVPARATVKRAGKLVCVTPCDVELDAGTGAEPLLVSRLGFDDRELMVQLTLGTTVDRSVELTRKKRRKQSTRRAAASKKRANKKAARKVRALPTIRTDDPRRTGSGK